MPTPSPQLLNVPTGALRSLIREELAKALAAHTAPSIPQDDDAFIDLEAVKALTGLGKTAVYEHVPGRVSLGPRCARWQVGPVRRWLREQANKGGAQ
jgi:predicted DNA-binding transcriptional regulator AlpA